MRILFLPQVRCTQAQLNSLSTSWFRQVGPKRIHNPTSSYGSRTRAARIAQNPKTLERVDVPAKRTVKFKPGCLLRQGLECSPYVSGDASVLR